MPCLKILAITQHNNRCLRRNISPIFCTYSVITTPDCSFHVKQVFRASDTVLFPYLIKVLVPNQLHFNLFLAKAAITFIPFITSNQLGANMLTHYSQREVSLSSFSSPLLLSPLLHTCTVQPSYSQKFDTGIHLTTS